MTSVKAACIQVNASNDMDANIQAAAALKALRYEGQEYFWITDTQPRMVMHPLKPELEGRDLSDNKDGRGVRHFVQMAAPLAEILRRHLSGQAKHRLVRPECGEQRRTRVEHTGAGHHAEHAGPAGRSRIAIGHVAAGLFVAGADHLQLRLLEGVEQAIDLRAGQAEHGVDAMRDQA